MPVKGSKVGHGPQGLHDKLRDMGIPGVESPTFSEGLDDEPLESTPQSQDVVSALRGLAQLVLPELARLSSEVEKLWTAIEITNGEIQNKQQEEE